MRKKILAVALVVIIAGAVVIGNSVAWFQDSDSATNTFVIGSIEISLNEAYTGMTTDDYTAWLAAQTIIPGTANAVDKIVTISNNGDSGAYVRLLFAVPSFMNIVKSGENAWVWNDNVYAFTDAATGVIYNVSEATYDAELTSGITTPVAINSIFMSDSTTQQDIAGLTLTARSVDVLVIAQGIQAGGIGTGATAIEKATSALNTGFGVPALATNPFNP